MRALVTGGSGYTAAHIVAELLNRGHSVVTTVRSEAKANGIREQFPKQTESGQLGFTFVTDFVKDGAFDEAVVSDPPFDAIIHTASPLPHATTDPKKDIVEPAIRGTVGILHSAKKHAPSVKRIIITSSTASMLDDKKALDYEYSEKDWHGLELEDAEADIVNAYKVSKKLAERSAWEFLEKEKPNFTIATIIPPWIFGPLLLPAPTLSAVNFSNQYCIVKAVTGDFPSPGPVPSPWVDVRDVACAHVEAMENPSSDVTNKRFMVAAGTYLNKEVIDIIADEWPEHMKKNALPKINMETVDSVPRPTGFSNSLSRDVLGLKYRSLKECVVDTVRSLPELDL